LNIIGYSNKKTMLWGFKPSLQ